MRYASHVYAVRAKCESHGISRFRHARRVVVVFSIVVSSRFPRCRRRRACARVLHASHVIGDSGGCVGECARYIAVSDTPRCRNRYPRDNERYAVSPPSRGTSFPPRRRLTSSARVPFAERHHRCEEDRPDGLKNPSEPLSLTFFLGFTMWD